MLRLSQFAILTGVWSLLLIPLTGRGETANLGRVQPWAENLSYWQYQGQPVVLVGGTRNDNLFQEDVLHQHLDALQAAGGNYVRNTMSSRDDGDIWPFVQLPDGKYDLTKLSDSYYSRFERLLRLAFERNIIVQIELWDRFDFAREPWLRNPYRPENNMNYTAKESGLENNYPRHPLYNDNRFFYSVGELDNNLMLLGIQQRQVDRLLEIALQFPNVLYCIDNETSGDEEWGAHWAKYIRQKAETAGTVAYVTEMWDDRDLRSQQQRRTLDNPRLYTFVDISQNNHKTEQQHWDQLQWVRRHLSSAPRPINSIKVYGASTHHFGTDDDGIQRFWRNMLGGCAAVRFHRQPHGLGLNEKAQTTLRTVRKIEQHVKWWEIDPHQELLENCQANEAYMAAKPGGKYVLYFPHGGTVTLDLTQYDRLFHIKWIDIATAEQATITALQGGEQVTVTAPSKNHSIAVIWRD